MFLEKNVKKVYSQPEGVLERVGRVTVNTPNIFFSPKDLIKYHKNPRKQI